MDSTIKEMIDKGVMHETEAPFDETENEHKDESKKITLPHTLELQNPFEFPKGTEVTEVTFVNRLTTKMIMHIPVNTDLQYGHYVPVIAEMIGKPVAFVKSLTPSDLIYCINVVTYFFFK